MLLLVGRSHLCGAKHRAWRSLDLSAGCDTLAVTGQNGVLVRCVRCPEQVLASPGVWTILTGFPRAALFKGVFVKQSEGSRSDWSPSATHRECWLEYHPQRLVNSKTARSQLEMV